MKRGKARRILTDCMAVAIETEIQRLELSNAPDERGAMHEVTNLDSSLLYRMAARAAVAVLEAGKEGERLGARG